MLCNPGRHQHTGDSQSSQNTSAEMASPLLLFACCEVAESADFARNVALLDVPSPHGPPMHARPHLLLAGSRLSFSLTPAAV